ncbi:hypothetical protein V2A60_004354 [Cordyceps javanica]|uniref:Uncharacterized protein n=1 Tax=Cordyceps javanica TaxID=43265 RepID=A0A545VR18_9HYPO|nr:hypothetical protein IF1G_09121 [Cordyceps javanica]TQW04162.1 hypothetical protein IF2G_08476 [Cordyceps javanica]
MHFQILAPAALLAGIASALPTNSSVAIFPETGFGGKVITWPIDSKCHDIADEAPNEAGCKGSHLDIGAPGALDLLMILKWAVRAKAIMCEKTAPKEN